MLRPVIAAVAFIAGCSDKPTPVAVPVAPRTEPARPVVEVSPAAATLFRRLATAGKMAEPWWVRLSVVWEPNPQIHVDMDRKAPGLDDYATEASGVKIVFARELLTYLRGCRIEVIGTDKEVAFDVTFPNQDASEREASGKWFREESAKHKAATTETGK